MCAVGCAGGEIIDILVTIGLKQRQAKPVYSHVWLV